MVLGRDISGRVEVCMQLKATLATHKATARTAVVAGVMPTPTAGLGGMSRINRDHRTAPFFGLVRDKGAQLRKGPAMHAARGFGLTLDGGAGADVSQVFNDEGCARRVGLHQARTQGMIAVSAEAGLFPSQMPQVSFGRGGATALELALELEALALDVLPAFLPQECRLTRHSGLGQSKVNADHLTRGYENRRRQCDDDMQVPTATAAQQVGGIDRKAGVFLGVGWDMKAHGLPSACCRKPHGTRGPVNQIST